MNPANAAPITTTGTSFFIPPPHLPLIRLSLRVRLRCLEANLFQKLRLLLQFRFSGREFVEAQHVREDIGVLLPGEFSRRALGHGLANTVEQIAGWQPIP